jgi:uncharacterized membrane protein
MTSFAIDDTASGKDPVNIIRVLLKELSVPVTDAAIRDSVLSHPYYPSLLCVSESLERWGVDTLALEVVPAGLSQLPRPFLAHCPSGGDDPYRIVKDAGEKDLLCLDGRRRERWISLEEFCNSWDGRVLVMEKREESGETGYSGRWWKEAVRRVGMLLAVLIVLSPVVASYWKYVGSPVNSWAGRGYFLFLFADSFLGLAVSALLFGYEHGWGGAELQRFCTLNGKMSCQSVLRSSAARLWGQLGWSEIGVIYFTGSLLYGALAATLLLPMGPLVLCQYLAIGYVVFSVSYQGWIARKWCLLCLAVQGVFAGQAFVAFGTGQAPDLAVSSYFIAAFGLPTAAWWLLRPLLVKAAQGESAVRRLDRLKRNEHVFGALWAQSDRLRNDPAGIGITIGNESAEHSLLVVSSPFCGPCAKAHPQLERLIDTGKWKARLIFSIVEEDPYAIKIVNTFFHAADGGGEAELRRTLHAWFGGSGKWSAKWSSPDEDERGVRIPAMINWCRREGIRHTPLVYIDGRKMPDLYEIGDLLFLSL